MLFSVKYYFYEVLFQDLGVLVSSFSALMFNNSFFFHQQLGLVEICVDGYVPVLWLGLVFLRASSDAMSKKPSMESIWNQ